MLEQILGRIKSFAPLLLSLYIVQLLLLFAVTVTSLLTGIAIGDFLRDPAATMETHPFIGVISNVGILLWTATTTICLFSWSIVRHNRDQKQFSILLLYSGLMTMLLLFDDLFLLHEVIFPDYLGIPETLVFIGYGGLMLFGAVKFKKSILETEYLILLTSLGFFAASQCIDVFQDSIQSIIGGGIVLLLEDGFKLLGIAGWFGYFLRSCSDTLRPAESQIPESPSTYIE